MSDINLATKLISVVIDNLLIKKEKIIIAIDGKCASGKSTIAANLTLKFDCNIFHMDDFFLRPEHRTKERYNTPGGNIDYERFKEEVLVKIKYLDSFEYRKFNCKKMSFEKPTVVDSKRLNIVEGVYSMHHELISEYDFKVFLKISEDRQKLRILKRNGIEYARMFDEKWIPYENKYFKEFKINELADIVISIDQD